MNLEAALALINDKTARAFVTSAKAVIDALLIAGEQAASAATPPAQDYETADLRRDAPAGGWIGAGELRATQQRMAEAIANEKWIEGVTFALKALSALGAL